VRWFGYGEAMETILCDRGDGIAWVTLNRPRRQALELADLYVRAGSDREATRQSRDRFASGKRVDWCRR
jgi:enoyl-CoA hydratase/carnithine racemase